MSKQPQLVAPLPAQLYADHACVKWSGDGRDAGPVTVYLDVCHHLLTVKTIKDGKKTVYHINQLNLVTIGNKPKDTSKIKKYLNTTDEIVANQCMGLYFGPWPWRELNLTLTTPENTTLWRDRLQVLLNKGLASFKEPGGNERLSTIDYWLQCQYIELQRQNGGVVHAVMALGSFAGLRLWKAYKVLQDLIEQDPVLKSRVDLELHNVSFAVFQAIYFTHMAKQRPDLQHIFKAHCSSEPGSGVPLVHPQPPPLTRAAMAGRRRSSIGMINFRGWSSTKASAKQTNENELNESPPQKMNKEAFFKFLTNTQRVKGITEQAVDKMIRSYDLVPEDVPVTSISLKGFTHYMLSQEAAVPEKRGVVNQHQDMSKPLHDYFIASSHNTYLTGHQLHGESSAHMYTLVLCSGCRCVELDCWDGEGGDPIIYHGHTLTSKIKFKDVVQVISKHAFTASPYPLILSLENHCSVKQQVKMVEYMKSAFGDRLLTQPVNDNMDQLPSPEELKYKILIKNRKLTSPAACDGPPPDLTDPGLPKLDLGHRRRSLINFSPFSTPSNSPLIGGRFFSRGSTSSFSRPTSPITPYNLSPTLTTSPHTLSPTPTASPHTPSPPSPTQYNLAAVSRKLSLSHGNESESSRIPISPHSPNPTPMFTIMEEVDSSRLPHHKDVLATCKADPVECNTNLCEEDSDTCVDSTIDSCKASTGPGSVSLSEDGFSQRRGRRSAVMTDTDSDPAILSQTEHGQYRGRGRRAAVTKETFQADNEETHLEDSTPHYSRSNSCPSTINEDLLKSNDENTPPHRPLSRTASMDLSLGLMEWWSSSQGETNRLSSSLNTLSHSQKHKLPIPLQNEIKTHKRNSSLPVHIQRVFPELATPTRPKSPLVLHQLRSMQEPNRQWKTKDKALTQSTESLITKKSLYNRRRRGSLGVTILRSQTSQDLSIPSPSVSDHTSSCPDTADVCYQSKDIAKELSGLVVYTEPVKFNGLKNSCERKTTEMFSMSENVAKKASKKTPLDFISFNTDHMSRVYPSATRINSSNYNPAPFWMFGCQMVALNYQTNDVSMQHYMSVFSQNGSSGYILRPQSLLENSKKFLSGEELVTMAITLTLVSGQHLQGVDHSHLPTAEIEVLGAPYDCSKVRCHANSVSGVCVLWNSGNVLQANIAAREIAVVKFTVYSDKNQDNILYSRLIPLSSVAMGYQHVYLSDQGGDSPTPPPSLFIHALIEDTPSSGGCDQHPCDSSRETGATNEGSSPMDTSPSCPSDVEMTIENSVICGDNHMVDHVINTEDHVMNVEDITVEVSVSEVEEHPITIGVDQDDVVSDLVQKIIDQVGLGGDVNEYIIVDTANGDEVTLESCDLLPSDGALRLENAPSSDQPQLALVPIFYTDLPGVDHEPITLFADSTTTAGELLSGTVARLGTDVETICPQLKDRDDEEEIQKLFCFVFAGQSPEGMQMRKDTLGNEDLILPLFSEPGSCLLLNIKPCTCNTETQAYPLQSTETQPYPSQSIETQAYHSQSTETQAYPSQSTEAQAHSAQSTESRAHSTQSTEVQAYPSQSTESQAHPSQSTESKARSSLNTEAHTHHTKNTKPAVNQMDVQAHPSHKTGVQSNKQLDTSTTSKLDSSTTGTEPSVINARPPSLVPSVDTCDGEDVPSGSFIVHNSVDDTGYSQKAQLGEQVYFTSTKVRPVSPEVAKHYIEEFYQKLEARVSQLDCNEPKRKKAKKKSSSVKRRTVSFNQNDLQRQKVMGNHSNRRQRHSRRMSVDVGLLLGQSEGQSTPKLQLLKQRSSGSIRVNSTHTTDPSSSGGRTSSASCEFYTDLDEATVQFKKKSIVT